MRNRTRLLSGEVIQTKGLACDVILATITTAGLDADDDFDPSSHRGVTGLINLSTASGAKQAFRPLLTADVLGDIKVGSFETTGLLGILHWLETAATKARRADVATIVVYIDDTTILTQAEVNHLVNYFRLGLLAVTTRVVIVTANPAAWDGCGFSGYVTSPGITTPSTAALTFLALASDVAPETFTCLEFEDFDLSTDGLSPSLLIEASWIREARELLYPSASDRDIVRSTRFASLVPLMNGYRMEELRDLCASVRADLAYKTALSYAAPIDFDPFGYAHEKVAQVVLFCRLP